jgi:hypothetical protein
MKTILATLFVSAALMGAAHAEMASGTLKSFDLVTGTIVFEDGKTFAADMDQMDGLDLVPIKLGTMVNLTLNDGDKLVTDIRVAK